MDIVVNGAPRTVPDALSVRALLVHLGLGDGPVAVELNREIVPRAEHASRAVSAGDTVEVVHLVGGG